MKSNIRNFCIIAHIDHGKSTLADRLLEQTATVAKEKMHPQMLDMMDLERERGITIKLQPVRMKYREYILNLIDTPGHVDFSYEVSRSLAAVEGAILVVDATVGIQAQTLANSHLAQELKLAIIPVVNKIDLPNAEVEKTANEISQILKVNENEIIFASAKTGEGVDQILDAIINRIPAASQQQEKPLRALIFDSVYDSFRGVIAYVRVVEGTIGKQENIKLMATNIQTQADEIGYFKLKYEPSQEIAAGEIGYIVTGLKDVSLATVGDTITKPSASPSLSPIAGYKKIKAMVFASIYPVNDEPEKVREALEKLSLSDSSLEFVAESSPAFGFGFRCGFQGLLHMEIVKERLEREYGLDLIITTPQVAYKTKTVGAKIEYEEPWVNLEIICPKTYLGAIMELAQSRRAIYRGLKYIGERVILEYEAPLASIIIDFYDCLKSVSSGFASMNYELAGYRPGDLVRLDILVAGQKIDEFSQIVPRKQLQTKARQIVEKLKNLIPRQMFEVSIQAAINVAADGKGQGKIIARENIPAMRKDVTAKLYGGDVTRKRKLLEKQKMGKKKMKTLGKLDIPSDVFIKLLR
jgi:GTP-binding protein LepA